MALPCHLLRDRKGASAAEYAALLGLIGAALALAVINLSNEIACSVEKSALMVEGREGHPDHPRGTSDPEGNAKGHYKHCQK